MPTATSASATRWKPPTIYRTTTGNAAALTAMEMPGVEVTKALASELDKLPADKQILLTLTFGTRADAEALPALYALAKSGGAKNVRIAAISTKFTN